jgi:hypothetical protein
MTRETPIASAVLLECSQSDGPRVVEANRHAPWRAWAALAVMTACGGTTGLEHIDGGDAASMGSISKGADSSAGVDSFVAADASAGTDASSADGADLDRTIPGRPPAQDTGVLPATTDSGSGPAPKDAGGILNGDGGLPTTLDILAALTDGSVQVHDAADDQHTNPPCVACFLNATYGCSDPTLGGGSCETIYDGGMPVTHYSGQLDGGDTCESLGLGAGANERAICLQALTAIFSTKCSAGQQLTPCLCGTTDPTMCTAGAAIPTGPLYETYACDFNSTKGSDINTDFLVQSFGAGMANSIVQCLIAFNTDPLCCSCFGGMVNDGGTCIVH